MTKAEEAAWKRFPDETTKIPYQELIDAFGGKTEVDFNELPRCYFQLGYEQAEKDLADVAQFSSGPDGFFYGKGYQQAKKDLGWISVKERLPEVEHYVFTCCDNQGTPQSVAVGFYDSDGSWFDDLDGRIDVDYWMEVPKFNNED